MRADAVTSTPNSPLERLRELALDLRWSWNHATDDIWRRIDPDLWERTHNPWVVFGAASPRRLEQLLSDPGFCGAMERLTPGTPDAAVESTWFRQAHANSPLTRVAYFSMEFMLSEALPIYAGGLGNVAGDQLKSASDLGVPVTGVGLLYQQGYFRQTINADGAQQALYPYNDPGQLPVTGST
jgi:starch phosphorylase